MNRAAKAFLAGLPGILATLLTGTAPRRPAPVQDVPKPARILWVGSSSLYYHNQPKVLAEWLTRFGDMPAMSEIVGRSGTGVHAYLRSDFKAEYGLKPGEGILEKIRRKKYRFVVLQVPAEFINGPEGEEHDRSLDVYCVAIREAGGQPVFYEMGWGRDDKTSEGRRKILAAALRNQITLFAPCSSAWERVRRERPDLELQNPPDRAHPGTLGAYLNLCCFYSVLAGREPPSGISPTLRIWPRLSNDAKKAFDEKVKSTVFDDYDNALPAWMKRLLIASREVRIEDEVAAYLRRTAWQEVGIFRVRLVRDHQQGPLPEK